MAAIASMYRILGDGGSAYQLHLYTVGSTIADTYDHRTLKTRLPVRSALFKQRTGGLVVRWVTTSEYPLLYVFVFLLAGSAELFEGPGRKEEMCLIVEWRRRRVAQGPTSFLTCPPPIAEALPCAHIIAQPRTAEVIEEHQVVGRSIGY
jgi:hypothetical protein